MPARNNQRTHTAALILALLPLTAIAQEEKKNEALYRRPSITALRVDTPPVLDGKMNDAAWANAQVSEPLRQEQPEEGAPATEKTVFRVVYTSEALYIGVWCFDREPGKIISRLMSRDSPLPKDDAVCIALDPFLDRRNGYWLMVNPNGAQGDALVTNNTDINDDWDGIWSVGARIDEEGWKVEVEIPFKSISFDPEAETWGINISRHIRRRHEWGRWSRPLMDFNTYQVSEAGNLRGIHGIEQGLGLEFTPYAVTKFRDQRELDDTDLLMDIGGDLRYRITPNLSLSMSYNTDFAETEIDRPQINLSRFKIKYPEKRNFFLQEAGIFNFGRNSGGRRSGPRSSSKDAEPIPFFSREVGLTPDRKPRSIVGATKLTGRIGEYNIGLLDAYVDDHEDLPGSNVFVGRISRNILEQSYMGIIATHGDPNSSNDDFLFGADLGLRTSDFLDGDVLQANLWMLGSWKENEGAEGVPPPEDPDSDNSLSFGGNIELPNDNYNANLQFFQVGEDFDPALGFVRRESVRAYISEFGYKPRPRDFYDIRQLFFSYSNSFYTDLNDELETASHSLYPLYILTNEGDRLWSKVTYENDSPTSDFEVSSSEGISITAGDYWWPTYRVGIDTSSKRLVEFEFSHSFGGYYDGDRNSWQTEIAVRPSKYFSIRADYELESISLPQGNFKERLASIRTRVSLSPQLNWSNLLQYYSDGDQVGFQSRIHWEYEPGSNMYLVLNQGIDRNDGRLRWTESDLTFKIGLSLRF
jgi:hypothetical protein